MSMSGSLTRLTRPGLQLLNTALASGARGYASRELADRGFVVEPGFLTADEADRIMQDVGRFGDRSMKKTGVPGSHLRDRADKQKIDLNVRQLTGAEALSPVIAELVASHRITTAMSRLAGFELRLGGMTVQIDWPDVQSKRGLHVDSHWPPTYKCFVYLTDVSGPENGPFSVVPGSHRHRLRKVKALAGNAVHGRKPTDMHREYRLADARPLTGGRGTAIFADQRLAHAGWPEHTTQTRFMLVAYLFRPEVQVPRFLRPQRASAEKGS